MPTPRNGRRADELRPLSLERGYVRTAAGSVLVRAGNTAVICTASVDPGVPAWLAGRGRGWLTAEYSMLPASTRPRKKRDRGPSLDGRASEIQRLIGRSLRSVVDLARLGEATITIDCDVLEADGGTRTAGITGAWVALADALDAARDLVPAGPAALVGQVAAVTQTIRVGAGGVMLPNHAPLLVAERYRMLEALFPGRIDLGVGRAPG